MRRVDLSRIDSIHQFVERLEQDGITIDILFLNAATTLPRARRSESGQDEMFLVNYLSNVILSNLLIVNKIIKAGNEENKTLSRVIFISSDSHQGSTGVDYDEFGRFFDYGVSKAISNYSYFKFLLNTYATELSRRVNPEKVNISVNAICPGPVASNIVKEAPWLLRITLKAIFRVIFRSPAKAVGPVIYMALSNDYEGTTNEYMHMFNPKKMDPKVYIPGEGIKLWDESMKLWRSIDPLCLSI
jgi:NAD(P)-dependent dehydrogenase (short-subunit alcohol dehydrogenase family)